jgi:hypothetical protein
VTATKSGENGRIEYRLSVRQNDGHQVPICCRLSRFGGSRLFV